MKPKRKLKIFGIINYFLKVIKNGGRLKVIPTTNLICNLSSDNESIHNSDLNCFRSQKPAKMKLPY